MIYFSLKLNFSGIWVEQDSSSFFILPLLWCEIFLKNGFLVTYVNSRSLLILCVFEVTYALFSVTKGIQLLRYILTLGVKMRSMKTFPLPGCMMLQSQQGAYESSKIANSWKSIVFCCLVLVFLKKILL